MRRPRRPTRRDSGARRRRRSRSASRRPRQACYYLQCDAIYATLTCTLAGRGGSAQCTRFVRAAERRRAVAAETRGRVIVTVAPNGGRKTKADHPALPLTADELARTAAECLERGASMIHLHVRDKDGGHSLDPEAYRSVIAR